MRRIINMLTISLLAVGLVAGTTVAATNKNVETKKFDASNRPEKPENEVIGKITSINADSITINLAEMKMPEGRTDAPKQSNDNNGNNDNQNKERPDINFNIDDMFTLTGNTKTYTITNANLIKNKRHELNKDDNANKEEMKKKTREELEAENKATYTDFAVGDYVIIELESSTSTTAKTVRSFDRMGGRGFGFGFERNFDKDDKNSNKDDKRKNGQK